MVFWYVMHVKLSQASKIIEYFNQQETSTAFIPKKEQWYNIKGVKDYVIKDLYPDYIFIKSKLNKNQFKDLFKEVLVYEDIYVLKKNEQAFFERLFDKGNVIRHSTGDSINGKFIAENGPLKGLEDKIIKVDRHHRFAVLKCDLFNEKFIVPIEIVCKL